MIGLVETQYNVHRIFLIYMGLVGDAEKTAIALGLKREVVEQLATREGWAETISRLSLVSKSGKPGDWERMQNRALNFVQCYQLRRIMDEQIAKISEMDTLEMMTTIDRNGGKKLSARIFSDLTTAMQKLHEMTYNALGDSIKERTVDKPPDDDASAAGLHSAMIAALNQKSLPVNTNAQTLADAASSTVESLKSANPK